MGDNIIAEQNAELTYQTIRRTVVTEQDKIGAAVNSAMVTCAFQMRKHGCSMFYADECAKSA